MMEMEMDISIEEKRREEIEKCMESVNVYCN